MDKDSQIQEKELKNDIIEGRNAVIEALRAGRAIDKIFIAKGDVDKTLGHIASKARDKGIVVVEADRRKLDFMSQTHAHQGVVAMVGVFIDTFVVLTMTALVVISTLYAGNGILASGAAEGISKTNMAQIAFSSIMGNTAGSLFVAICLMFFAFSTIIGWGLYGARCAEFLFGSKIILPFNIAYALISIVGATVNLGLVWDVSDTFNGFMIVPNLIAVFLLAPTVLKLLKDYFEKEKV